RLPPLPLLGLAGDGRLRPGRSGRPRVRRVRPGGVLRLRLRTRARAHRAAPLRDPGHPAPLAERPASPRAVLMKVPLSWLADYVELRMPISELADRLAVSTCEVDRISRRGVADVDGNFGLYKVGRVVEAGKHPNADRLQLCRVDVGESAARQIVFVAWNVGAGAKVPVALPGGVLREGHWLDGGWLRSTVTG